ncbi:MAG: SDR family oxidoreductase [Pseudomonadota bacterium]
MNIFMTGATGFVGGEVAARLTAEGHGVTALVRRSQAIRANDGSIVTGIGRVQGDIAEPRLGLDADRFREVSADHDLVIHCAATTRFDLDDDAYSAINIGGTTHAVDLARLGGIPLLHVSTAYVCGTRDGPIREDDPLPDQGWANGYERSKAAAERIVADSGLRHAIARPSIVVGDSETGRIRDFGAVYGLFKLIAEGRFKRIPAVSGASLDFVAIDYVASGIAELAGRIDEAEGAYHLVSGAPVPLDMAVGLVAGFANLHAPQLVDPGAYDVTSLSARERWIFDNAFAHYGSYVTRDPRFDDRRFRGFSATPRPATDIGFVRKLIEHAIEAGFVKAA